MSDYVVKTYKFKLAPNTPREDFVALNAQMDQLLLKTQGFVYRSLAETADNEWLDIVYWSSQDIANKAEAIMGEEIMKALMSAIDVETVTCDSATILTQVYPEMLQNQA